MNAIEAALNELAGFELFAGYEKNQILELCHSGQIISSNHRDFLFHYGKGAHFFGIILSGAYKLTKPSPLGEDVIVHFATPGEALAAFIMAQPSPLYPVSAIAMGPSRFLKIPKINYITLWKKNSELILRVQNMLSNRMNLLQEQKVMSKSPLSHKIASLLIHLLDKEPEKGNATNDVKSNALVKLPMTRKEIADSLGASVESVIRIMSDWSKQGVIQTVDQQIFILKVDKIIEHLNEVP